MQGSLAGKSEVFSGFSFFVVYKDTLMLKCEIRIETSLKWFTTSYIVTLIAYFINFSPEKSSNLGIVFTQRKMQRQLLIIIVNLFIINGLLAQKQANIWYFGNKSGMDYSTGVPQKILGGEMMSFEGCASFSDENGSLLFYTNGGGTPANSVTGYQDGIIWNKNDEVIYDMMIIEGGGYRAAQSSLFLPGPGEDSTFYLFTMADNNTITPSDPNGRGLSYFEIDLALNNGLGEVIAADQRIHAPAFEGLSATIHANGRDFWIISLDDDSKDFVVVLLNDFGVQTPDFQPSNLSDVNFLERVIKISPDGQFLCTGKQLYAFDNATGQLNFLTEITQFNSYCFSFSSQNRYLYSLSSFLSGQVIRYDLEAADIDGSREVIDPFPASFFPGLMQIGPDNNLYFLHQTTDDADSSRVSMAFIRCPDTETPEFNPVLFQFDAGDDDSFSGLPNYADYIFSENQFDIEIQNGIDTLVGCPGDEFVLDAIFPDGDYEWSNGDSTQAVSVFESGIFSVTVTNFCGDVATDSIWIEIVELPAVEIESEMGTEMCPKDTFELKANSQNTIDFIWSTGEINESIFVSEPGTYSITVSNSCGSQTTVFEITKKEDCCQIKYPNVFTPDNDAMNDTFIPYMEDCEFLSFQLKIYSRWGDLVFETSDSNDGWDGRQNGKNLGSDVFVWQLHYELLEKAGELFKASGDLTLLR